MKFLNYERATIFYFNIKMFIFHNNKIYILNESDNFTVVRFMQNTFQEVFFQSSRVRLSKALCYIAWGYSVFLSTKKPDVFFKRYLLASSKFKIGKRRNVIICY